MRIKILLPVFIALALTLTSHLVAQVLAPNCDTSSFKQDFMTQLPTWAGIDAETAKSVVTALANCTDFISCLPTATSAIQPFITRSAGTYCTGSQLCPTDWATICPECIMAIALIITTIIYFNQTQNSAWTVAFPLADLATNLQAVLNSNGAPATENCGSLFSWNGGLQCESTSYLGQLYETLAQIAWAKQDAIALCYKASYQNQYATQTNGLANCMADLLPTLLGRATATIATCPTVPCAADESCVNGICFPSWAPNFLQNDIVNLKTLLSNYLTYFTGLTNCCAAADQLCQLTLGANYSTAILSQPATGTNRALTGLQNLIGYQAFSFTAGA